MDAAPLNTEFSVWKDTGEKMCVARGMSKAL